MPPCTFDTSSFYDKMTKGGVVYDSESNCDRPTMMSETLTHTTRTHAHTHTHTHTHTLNYIKPEENKKLYNNTLLLVFVLPRPDCLWFVLEFVNA